GYSFFGDSFVYILLEDGTDPYWARSRVLEYLNQVQSRLPPQAKTSLGPDATGVGWVYEYALVDRSGRMDLSQLRALQDWFLKYELKAVTNVSEVASVGGMVKQYQIVIDPVRLRAFNISHAKVVEAVQRANQETGGSVLELGEAEYMVRASGYLQSLDDFRKIPLALGVRRHRFAAARDPGGFHRHVLPGRERQHHVARRHRHRDRRDGGCRGGDDRERAQAARSLASRTPGRDARGRGTLGRDRRGRRSGRAGAFRIAPDHHLLLRSGVHARSAGGAAFLAARLYKDLRDGRGSGAGSHAHSGADGLSHPRAHSGRRAESHQPFPHRALSPAARKRARPSENGPSYGGRDPRGDALANEPPRRRVHAAAR